MNTCSDQASVTRVDRADSLTMKQIITFCKVYEHCSYAGATETLGLAGATIWEQVKTIEKIYKTKLFERTGRTIQAAAAGATLYEMLRPILESVFSTFDQLESVFSTFDQFTEEINESALQISLATGVRMILEDLAAPLREFKASKGAKS
jgi:DNA-binding transcriptional LysR family regulator